MEKRTKKIHAVNAGGTASPGSKKYIMQLPAKWVKELGLEGANAIIAYDGKKITIEPEASQIRPFFEKDREGHDLKQLDYYDGDVLCTRLYADFTQKEIVVENFTENMLKRAFGVREAPSWSEFETFLEERCIPAKRAGINHYLEALGVDAYDPYRIVALTKGRMAEDHQWLKIKEIK